MIIESMLSLIKENPLNILYTFVLLNALMGFVIAKKSGVAILMIPMILTVVSDIWLYTSNINIDLLSFFMLTSMLTITIYFFASFFYFHEGTEKEYMKKFNQ